MQDFAQFVAVRYGDLLRTAYLLTGSQYAAEDLVQSCLLRAMSRWDRIDDPSTYLRRAMVNDRISRWRRLRRELLRGQVPDTPVPDDSGRTELRADLLAALDRLPPRMRAVLVLRYWDDLTEAATAAALGCGVGSVKSQASRGLARLRSLLDGSGLLDGSDLVDGADLMDGTDLVDGTGAGR